MISLTELRKLEGKPLKRKRRDWTLRNGPLDTRCWIWQGPTSNGYPRKPSGKRGASVWIHRLHVEEKLGVKLPSDVHVHHVCENRRCVNPDHLQPLTRSDHGRAHHSRRRFGKRLDTSWTFPDSERLVENG